MIKRIKKYGQTAIISFTKEELDNMGWEFGTLLDLSDVTKYIPEKGKEKMK